MNKIRNYVEDKQSQNGKKWSLCQRDFVEIRNKQERLYDITDLHFLTVTYAIIIWFVLVKIYLDQN